MKKWLLIGAAVIVLIIGVLIIGISNLGPLIKKAVNTYGPTLTKTDVSLGDVGISILSGKAKLKDFSLSNPQGFKTPIAIEVGSIYVDVDERSLTSDTIVIDTIEIIKPQITYEKARGTDNFKTILRNVQSAVGTQKAQPQEAEEGKEGPSKNILIRDFIVKEGNVTLATALLGGKSISAPLPDIHLQNVGGEGASPAKVFGEIFKALHEKITSPEVTDIFNQGLKEFGKDFGADGDRAKEEAKTATERFKGLFGK